MNDLHDIVTAARPPPTWKEAWQARQRRLFTVFAAFGLAFFIGGVAWITRPEHDGGVGVTAILVGFVLIVVAGWFGLRAVVGEPPEA